MAKAQLSQLMNKFLVWTILIFLHFSNYGQPILMFVSHEQTYYSEYIVMKSGLEAAGYTVEVRSATSMDFSIYMDPYLDIEAAASDGGGYAQFQTQFQNSFGSTWDEGLNAIPQYASVAGSIVEIESMDGYSGLIVVGGLGALDYRVDGQYEAQGEGLREISADLVQQAAEKLNELAVEALSQGKPVMAQCHGSSIPVFWRVPGTSGPGVETFGYSLLKEGKATGFPDSDTPPLLSDFGIQHMEYDRVTISDPYSEIYDDGQGNGLVLTTRDWYPQTVAYAARTFINILDSYPSLLKRSNEVSVLILHGGSIDEFNCGPGNRLNDIPCNYPGSFPADYQDLFALLDTESEDGFSFVIEDLDITSASLPYENQMVTSIYEYLSGFDVIVFYKHWSTGFTDQLLQALNDYVDDGGGLVALHHALYNEVDPGGQSKDILVDLFGAQSSEDGWSAGMINYDMYSTNYGHFISSFMLSYDSASLAPEAWATNPVPAGSNYGYSYLPRKSVFDEIYYNMAFEGDAVFGREVNQIFPLFSNDDNEHIPVIHTTSFLKEVDLDENLIAGKIFYLQVGENPDNYSPVSFIGQVIRNATFWVAPEKLVQSISFDLVETVSADQESIELTATSDSGLPIAFQSTNTEVIEIIGTTATIKAPGTVSLIAVQSGNSEYYASQQSREITVLASDKMSQIITWSIPDTVYMIDQNFDIEASVSSDLPLSISSDNDNILEVLDSQILIKNAGTATITIFQEGNSEYEEATVDHEVVVLKSDQVLTVSIPDHVLRYGSAPFKVETSVSSLLPAALSLSTDTVLAFTDSMVSITGSGKTWIIAVQAGDSVYNSVTDSVLADILPADLSIAVVDTFSVYGDDPPAAFDFAYSGFVNMEGIEVISQVPDVILDFNVGDEVGNYPIRLSGGTADNYNIILKDGNLAIKKAKLKIVARDMTVYVGESFPTLNLIYEGFRNEDSEIDIDQLPSVDTSQIDLNTPGLYDIILVGGEDNNYFLELDTAKLEVIDNEEILGFPATGFSIKVFPNPFSKSINVRSKGCQNCNLVVMDMDGGVVIDERISDRMQSIFIPQSGIYLLQVMNENAILERQLIVNR